MEEPTALSRTLRFDLVPDDPALLPVRLVCGPQLILGRNKEECDLVSWFLPRSEENDRETRKLSQVHAILQHEGARIRVRDADSGSGTFWNQQPVPPGEGLTTPVGPTGRLMLGRHFGISVEWFPVSSPACAVLRPVSSEPAFRRCLWMTGTRCAVQRIQGEAGGPWLMPCHSNQDPDAELEARGGILWWQTAQRAVDRLNDQTTLRLADVAFRAED